MSDTPKDKDQEKGDEVLRRLLKTPPDHKTGKGERKPRDQSKKRPSPRRDDARSTTPRSD